MKRILMCVGGLALSIAFTAGAFAGAIDNKTNWSAEYIRTLNRNAATDYADIAAYNPAGTVKLSEGFILNGSVQFLSKKYENNLSLPSGVLNLESDEPSFIPGIFGVYNKGKWSLYGAFSNYGGGGKVDFSQGNLRTTQIGGLVKGMSLPFCPQGSGGACVSFNPTDLNGQQINAESHYLGYTLGAGYEVNDMLSFSVGLRYINVTIEANGSVTLLDAAFTNPYVLSVIYEQDGDGWGGIFGANIAPNDKLNIGMRYETKTKIDLKATVPAGVGANVLAHPLIDIVDGVSKPRDLPAILALGLSYRLTPKLRAEIDLTYYFNKDADWGGFEKGVDNGYDTGITFEYIFTDQITASIGYMHTELGVNPQDMLPENPELNVETIGGGIAYAFNEKFHTNFSIGNSFYGNDSFVDPLTNIPVEYKKNVFFVALGVEYRFM
ncbi:MAG: OmpP1/FadL family transporter [Desulfobulbales bacterium]